MLLYNKSKLPQVLNIRNQAIPIVIYPGMVFEPSNIQTIPNESFAPFTFDSFYNKDRIGFQRDFAMGDLIQLIPVVREFKKFYNVKEVEIYTSQDYYRLLKPLFEDIRFYDSSSMLSRSRCDLVYNLNGMLERDHSTVNQESRIHRVGIYFKSLGMPEDSKVDWHSDSLSYRGLVNMNTDRKKIGIQIRGSGTMKTLPYGIIKDIILELAKKYYVVLIDQSKDKGFNGENILNTCGKLNSYQVAALLTQLDCCITMDSGVLWLAHIANCPTLTILGPTREEERISLHPQYPTKAKAVNISKMIGCEPCFETRVHCKGAIKCMNKFDKNKLISEIQNKLIEIVGE